MRDPHPPATLEFRPSRDEAGEPVFDFSTRSFSSESGPRLAGVLTPRSRRLIGEQSLERFVDPARSDPDLLWHFRRASPRPAMWIIRGRGDAPEARWGLDPGLGELRAGVAHALLAQQLPTYRDLYLEGVALILHIELDPEDAQALREAAHALARAPRDRHLLQVATQFSTMPLDKLEGSSFLRQFRIYARKASQLTGSFPAVK